MKFKIFTALIFLIYALSFTPANCIAQSENTWGESPELIVKGFVDIFYVYDFGDPVTPYRQTFFYNHNRHNEININLGLVGLLVSNSKYRANITLQAGAYAIDNYALENSVMRNVFEAYAGISLNRKNNLWLDAGIFESHLGFESAISITNWTLTRSLVAENSPFFLTGAKVTYTPSEVVMISGVICNGWQRIQRVPGNTIPSVGTQLSITPNDNLLFNWSTFAGTDDPDSTRRWMIFNSFYAQMQLLEKFGLLAGVDFGFKQFAKDSQDYDSWYGITLIARYNFAKKWATALRGELYYDNKGVIVIIEDSPNGFRTSGVSMNIDFIPIPQLACRLEGRWLHSSDAIFINSGERVTDNVFINISMAVKIGKHIL